MKAALISGCLLFLSCDSRQAVIAEYRQMQHSCEVVEKSDLYSRYKLDPTSDVVIKYTFYLPPSDRNYLSGCGPQLDSSIPKSAALEGSYPDGNNPIFREIYYHLKLKSENQISMPFIMRCMVGGLSPGDADELRSENKAFTVQKVDETYVCRVATDLSSSPYMVGW